jgi:hypothetical protein
LRYPSDLPKYYIKFDVYEYRRENLLEVGTLGNVLNTIALALPSQLVDTTSEDWLDTPIGVGGFAFNQAAIASLCCPSHDTLGMRLLPISNVASRSASFRMILTRAFLTPTACRKFLRGEFFRENRGWSGERSQSAHSAPASARRFHDTGDDARGCVGSPANEVRADGQLARKVSVRAARPERSWACYQPRAVKRARCDAPGHCDQAALVIGAYYQTLTPL